VGREERRSWGDRVIDQVEAEMIAECDMNESVPPFSITT
jgi:hypothetical protein